MSAFARGYVNKATTMHIDSVPAIFAKNLKKNFGPFFEGLLLWDN